MAGYQAGDFPNIREVDQVKETVGRFQESIEQQKTAFELLGEFLKTMKDVDPDFRNEELCEKTRILLAQTGYSS